MFLYNLLFCLTIFCGDNLIVAVRNFPHSFEQLCACMTFPYPFVSLLLMDIWEAFRILQLLIIVPLVIILAYTFFPVSESCTMYF